MYTGNVATLPAGRAGMVAHENRLLSSSAELLDAQGVTFEDRTIRKEAGVSNFDPAGVGTAVYHTASLDTANNWTDGLFTFPGSAIAFVRVGGSILQTGSAASAIITVPAGGHASGNLLVLSVATDATSTSSPVTVTDSKGNTYIVGSNQGPVGSVLTGSWFAYCRLTIALVAGDTITITLPGPGLGDIGVCSAEFSGVTGNVDKSSFDSNHSPAIDSGSSALSVASVPVLLVASIARDMSPSSALSVGSGFTAATESPSSAAKPRSAIEYRIDNTAPIIISILDWYSGTRILSGGTKKAATTAGGTTVTGSAGTLWNGGGTETDRISPGDSIILYDANNMERRTVLSVASDTSLTTTESWTTGFAATDYVVVRGSRLLTATTGGNVFKERGGALSAVTLKTNLSKVARPGKFIICGKEDGSLNRKVIYVNGYDIPQGLIDDGSGMNAISNPAADWDTTASNAGARPGNGVVHRDRVVVCCPKGKDPHRLYFSSPTNHGDFVTAAAATTRRVRSDIGDELWGLASFQGVLWCWKYPVGIFYIDDSDLDPTNWAERTKSQAIGCAPSPYSVCPMDDDVIFMTATGAFHVLSAVDTLGGVRTSDLSWHLGLTKWLRDNLNLSRLNQTLSTWYPHKKTALFSVPAVGSAVNNLLLKFDFGGTEYQEPVKFSYSYQNIPDALALKRDTDGIWKPVIGEGVYVKLLERDARNKEGLSYTSRYQTPHNDLSQSGLGQAVGLSHVDPSLSYKRKLYEHLELIMQPTSGGTLTVDVYVDGSLKQTLTYDATKRRQRKLLRVGDGFTISVRVTDNGLNDDFKILAHLVYFKYGNEDESR